MENLNIMENVEFKKAPIRNFKDLEVYRNSYAAMLRINFEILSELPQKEKNDLTERLIDSTKTTTVLSTPPLQVMAKDFLFFIARPEENSLGKSLGRLIFSYLGEEECKSIIINYLGEDVSTKMITDCSRFMESCYNMRKISILTWCHLVCIVATGISLPIMINYISDCKNFLSGIPPAFSICECSAILDGYNVTYYNDSASRIYSGDSYDTLCFDEDKLATTMITTSHDFFKREPLSRQIFYATIIFVFIISSIIIPCRYLVMGVRRKIQEFRIRLNDDHYTTINFLKQPMELVNAVDNQIFEVEDDEAIDQKG